jgi:hypothetical protein
MIRFPPTDFPLFRSVFIRRLAVSPNFVFLLPNSTRIFFCRHRSSVFLSRSCTDWIFFAFCLCCAQCVLVSLNRPTAGVLSPFLLLRWTGNPSHSGANFSVGGQCSAQDFAREVGGSQVARCAMSQTVVELVFCSTAGSLDFRSARRCVCRSSVLRCVARSFGRSFIFWDFHVPLIFMAKAQFLGIIFPCH